MHLRVVLTLLLAILPSSVFAQPVITGISPSEGPTSGGTVVTITGSGFARFFMGAELLPTVYFDDIRARATTLVNGTTIVATTPEYVSGTVTVKVSQYNGSAALENAFTYTGPDHVAVDEFLLPVFVQAVPGAYGSEFRSELTIWNANPSSARLWGAGPNTDTLGRSYTEIPSGSQSRPGRADATTGPGRFIQVMKTAVPALAMTLRVFDTSRAATNLGTTIPIVPLSHFRSNVRLTGIPLDSRYRAMLRVYGYLEGQVRVTFGDESRIVSVARSHPSDAPYAEIPVPQKSVQNGSTLNITVTGNPHGVLASPVLDNVWAFVAVTNNETQHITTITPQPSR